MAVIIKKIVMAPQLAFAVKISEINTVTLTDLIWMGLLFAQGGQRADRSVALPAIIRDFRERRKPFCKLRVGDCANPRTRRSKPNERAFPFSPHVSGK